MAELSQVKETMINGPLITLRWRDLKSDRRGRHHLRCSDWPLLVNGWKNARSIVKQFRKDGIAERLDCRVYQTRCSVSPKWIVWPGSKHQRGPWPRTSTRTQDQTNGGVFPSPVHNFISFYLYNFFFFCHLFFLVFYLVFFYICLFSFFLGDPSSCWGMLKPTEMICGPRRNSKPDANRLRRRRRKKNHSQTKKKDLKKCWWFNYYSYHRNLLG